METMDKVIAGLGGVVLILAILALTFFVSQRTSENQLQAFADTGKNLDQITLIGESGLIAVTDATMAKIDALKETEELCNNEFCYNIVRGGNGQDVLHIGVKDINGNQVYITLKNPIL